MYQGIVLKKEESKEADFIVTIFSKDFGKIFLRAKGARKINSKLRGHLETLNYILFDFVEGKKDKILTAVRCVANFSNLKKDAEALRGLFLIRDTVDEALFVGAKEEDFFSFVLKRLSALDRNYARMKLKNYGRTGGAEKEN